MIRRRLPAAPARPKLGVPETAERLSRLAATMARLTEVISEETRLVRAGAYQAAGALETSKGELSSRYMLDIGAVSASRESLAAQPQEQLAEIERLHVTFRAALEENLAVLGTARSVAESLMRGVSEELAARETPRTYGADAAARLRAPSAPVALSRKS
ncbi:hypothetical protein GCM10008171_18410 [Methylopila jiangsuensis]|uniref:Flagellar basal-body protein FlbY n=1 Tax=Methylopila jiangsuensis TaxID=586230 RepID=A0A9W6N3Z2_9HYPH|nr:hypothetical protein [Methylopila jiangsuensis]MDR6287100.1 hypothetical protein [Methylopila jiangsuensis]GLK76587.1 hypothetical protein GCM10008171_18410 [Methylopila jiangsuensis]